MDRTARYFFPPVAHSADRDIGDQWALAFLELKPSEEVPVAVRQLFDAARGAMIYGHFYYPLYALGSEQVFRVLEAALAHRCLSLQAPASTRGYHGMLTWLRSKGSLPNFEEWNLFREMRNIGSHPIAQTLITPMMAFGDLERAVILVDRLFSKSD